MPDPRITELDGFNVIVDGRDARYIANKNDAYVGRSLIHYGEYCQEEYAILTAMTRPESVIVEVGANLGAHTARLAKHVTLAGRVIAFEPQPVIFQALCGTMSINNLMNVECFPTALGSEPATVTIPALDYRQPNNFGSLSLLQSAAQGVQVAVQRLDDVFRLGRLDLIKIDVEGMELDVLKGAQETISKFRPIIYFENDRPDKSSEILQWMFDAGYRLWWHFPALYNPQNHFQNGENIFGDVSSLNVLAVPNDVETSIGLLPITDVTYFPNYTVDTTPA